MRHGYPSPDVNLVLYEDGTIITAIIIIIIIIIIIFIIIIIIIIIKEKKLRSIRNYEIQALISLR